MLVVPTTDLKYNPELIWSRDVSLHYHFVILVVDGQLICVRVAFGHIDGVNEVKVMVVPLDGCVLAICTGDDKIVV